MKVLKKNYDDSIMIHSIREDKALIISEIIGSNKPSLIQDECESIILRSFRR